MGGDYVSSFLSRLAVFSFSPFPYYLYNFRCTNPKTYTFNIQWWLFWDSWRNKKSLSISFLYAYWAFTFCFFQNWSKCWRASVKLYSLIILTPPIGCLSCVQQPLILYLVLAKKYLFAAHIELDKHHMHKYLMHVISLMFAQEEHQWILFGILWYVFT